MEDLVIQDEVELTQSYLKDSFKVYSTTVEKNGTLSKGKLLESGKDFTVEIREDEETGHESFILKLHPNGNSKIEEAYLLEYDVIFSKIDGTKGNVTLKNKVQVSAK